MRKLIFLLGLLVGVHFPLYAQNINIFEEATMKVASDVGKAVVSISSTIRQKADRKIRFNSPLGGAHNEAFRRFFEDFFGELPEQEYNRMGLGSGVLIDKEGYILTNEHVISGATEIKVKLSDGREFDAEVKGIDQRSDLAVIKINAHNLPVVPLGNSDNLQIGRWVVAIGNPFGFAIENPEPTITLGVVSALHRYVPALLQRERSYDDLIQTDAAINPGNSGGPLVNLDGEVIGINTAIISTSGGYQGLGFAIPINKVKRILPKLIKGEKIIYGWLGVSIQDLNEDLRTYFRVNEKEGVLIVKIYKDSPAEISGLKEGDLILAFNKQTVKAARDLIRLVSFCQVGEIVSLNILREGREKTIGVKIEKRKKDVESAEGMEEEQEEAAEPVPSNVEFRGLKVEDITPVLRERLRIRDEAGVVVVALANDSLAQKSGLRIGDVIVKVDQQPVKNKKDFASLTAKKKGNCLLKTNRGYFVVKE